MQTGIVPTTATSTANATGVTATTASGGQTLGQDAFLQLLVSELKNQDPTQAQDPNAMISQMAQFSALEQQTNTNSLLTSMQSQFGAMFQAQSSSLIGQSVQVTSSSFNLSGSSASIGVNMPSAATKVTLAIQNAAGQTVATLSPGALAAGNQVVTWNGQDVNGNQLPSGAYTVNITATDANGNAVNATPTSFATVTSVNYGSDGTVTVTAGGQQYPLSAITQVAS